MDPSVFIIDLNKELMMMIIQSIDKQTDRGRRNMQARAAFFVSSALISYEAKAFPENDMKTVIKIIHAKHIKRLSTAFAFSICLSICMSVCALFCTKRLTFFSIFFIVSCF